ncbi:MAG: inositol-3-phosphate synthase [Euryarchaeota archaeon]|nr:inositol-3-phosphate synthase [Euryarchaeota archaeon]
MTEIRVAIAGVGNVASALVQGIAFYAQAENEDSILGLMHPEINGYKVNDIKIVAAFDVNKHKIGKDISQAIFLEPNNCLIFSEVPKIGIEVKKGPVLDGIGETLVDSVPVDENQKPVDVKKELENSNADVLVNLVPVGSDKAAKFYAEAAIDAGCAVINGMPAFVANNKEIVAKAEKSGVPVIGDDVKSQVGATIVHRALVDLLVNRGVRLKNTYQLNFGGDMDFKNMLSRERLKTKKITKTEAVRSLIPEDYRERVGIHIGPSDYVPFLNNQKIAYIRVEGEKFGRVPMYIDVKLHVHDAPNSAGCLVDCIRCAKIGLDRGISGILYSPSAAYMKYPPEKMPDPQAFKSLEEFITGKRER